MRSEKKLSVACPYLKKTSTHKNYLIKYSMRFELIKNKYRHFFKENTKKREISLLL